MESNNYMSATHATQVDRTTMGLFFSGNAMDWWPAGVLDYHIDFAYHFTYPHMTIVGDDLLVSPRDKRGNQRQASPSELPPHRSAAIWHLQATPPAAAAAAAPAGRAFGSKGTHMHSRDQYHAKQGTNHPVATASFSACFT